MIYIYK